jgi:hypothetical protein
MIRVPHATRVGKDMPCARGFRTSIGTGASHRWFGSHGLAWNGFAADAIAQHQKWQPEEPKCVIGAQLAVGDVDIEFLLKPGTPSVVSSRDVGSIKVR